MATLVAVIGSAVALAVLGMGGLTTGSLVADTPGAGPHEPVALPATAVQDGAALSAEAPVVSATDAPQAPASDPRFDDSFAGIAEPPPAPPKRTDMVTHTVSEGEVLWQIAERYGLRSETLLWVNDLDNPDLLLVGQTLTIPPVDGVLYTVRPGEHLTDVASRYGVDLGAVAEVNKIQDLDLVQADVDLFLPGARPFRPAQSAEGVVADPEQRAASILPPIPIPPNIAELLSSGWLRTEQEIPLYREPEAGARVLHKLPPGARLERLEGFAGGRIQVRDPGDGRTRQAMTGWIDALDLAVGRAPAPGHLSQAYPASAAMDIAHVFAPYRSQLDGTPYAEANCGPVTVGMALSAFGVQVSSGQLRTEVLNAQRIWGNHVGTLMTALAEVVEGHGLSALDLYARGGGLYRWSLDDIREHLQAGRPVVVQVRYRALPGRGGAYYFGDHYILITGLLPNGQFIYNDPIDHDGPGWDRVISPERLHEAMNASDRRYAYAAFAVAP